MLVLSASCGTYHIYHITHIFNRKRVAEFFALAFLIHTVVASTTGQYWSYRKELQEIQGDALPSQLNGLGVRPGSEAAWFWEWSSVDNSISGSEAA
jgi:hypothetical protein